ncbi:MAG: hypothetical protein JSV22_01705 [Bacteroidales bacterium]|nr:MAG: hypothetical protein JSV22_01705 [Bacteroidales bacterium]
MVYINNCIKYQITFCFILTCLVIFLSACKKDDDNICTIDPVFKTEDSIIVLGQNTDKAKIELVICDYNIEFYYTINGENPDINSDLYNPDSGIVLGIGDYLIKAKGFLNDTESDIVEKRYIISVLPLAELENFYNHRNYYSPVVLKLKNTDNIITYEAVLNDSNITLTEPYSVSEEGFYYLEITSKLDTYIRKDNYEFVILDEERGEPEWGLKAWTPQSFTVSTIGNEEVEIIYPEKYVANINMPFILKITENNELKSAYYTFSNSVNSSVLNLKRGIGSINLLSDNSINSVSFYINNRTINLPVELEEPAWMYMDEIIDSSIVINQNSRIYINKNITITKGVSVQVEGGAIFAVAEGINIINNGSLIINGTDEIPVVFTCINPDSFWGGIICNESGSEITVNGAIFCQSGYHNTGDYVYGHAQRQALFYMENSTLEIMNSYIIDNIGQIFYPVNSNLNIDNVLIQRAKTGGQINHSYISVKNSVFTDFPDDSYNYIDEDNDALYVNASDADIQNSVFMYARDDGIDSGGDLGGTINISNCRFEAIFHEGMALSSRNSVQKEHNIMNCTFTNCGQGAELGFSSPNHIVNIDSCHFNYNNIGIRYGDNYNSQVEGKMIVRDSYIVNNFDKDVWNMVRLIWQPKIDRLSFINTVVSMPVKEYPDLIVIN